MKLHQFNCKECKTDFFTPWAPAYDEEPAFCPNCGRAQPIEYAGEVEVDLKAKEGAA